MKWKCKSSVDSYRFLLLIICSDYIVYDAWLAVELLVVYFLFVETGNNSLEQTAALLDGVDAKDQLVEQVAKTTSDVTEIQANPDKKVGA